MCKRRPWIGAVMLALLAGASAHAAAQTAAPKRAYDLAPSADLYYTITARQKGIVLAGDSRVNWRADKTKYSVENESRAVILGKIIESRSEGSVDEYGLAPSSFVEKRFRKEQTTASFDRAAGKISFAHGTLSYALKGGEQDRASAQWQLAAMARAAPEKFVPGSEWRMFVAGRRDADTWTFKVVRREKVKTGAGEVDALHFVKAPPSDLKNQHFDIWLAPNHEWYPVKMRLSDEEGEYIEQVVDKIVKK